MPDLYKKVKQRMQEPCCTSIVMKFNLCMDQN